MGGRGSNSKHIETGIRKLKKANKSLNKQIRSHIEKIRHPERVYGKQWEGIPAARRESRLQHWKTEIRAFTKSKSDNAKKIKELRNK